MNSKKIVRNHFGNGAMLACRLWIGVLLTCICLASAWAQTPSFQVNGFNVTADPVNPNAYTFIPTFNGVPCTPDQLKHHLYEWEFSSIDYSLAQIPLRQFYAATPLMITLRVTGIKEEVDPDKTLPGGVDPDPKNNYFKELPPSKWATKAFPQPFTPTTLAPIPAASTPKLALETAAHNPVPDEPYKYLVVLENYTQCEFILSVSMSFMVNSVSQLISRERIDPAITCLVSNADCNTLTATIPPNTKFVVPLIGKIPAGVAVIGQVVDFGAISSFDPHSPGCTQSSDSTSNSLRVKSSIDPNMKWCYNGNLHLQGERIQFAIQFENAGNQSVNEVIIMDSLDPRLDYANVKPELVVVNGNEIHMAPWSGSSYIFSKIPGNAIQFNIDLSSRGRLKSKDSGYVVFSIPILPNVQALNPTELEVLGDSCIQLVTIPNRGYTMFPDEGVWYQTECKPALKVITKGVNCCTKTTQKSCCNWICWALGVAVILLFLIVILLMRRLRRP